MRSRKLLSSTFLYSKLIGKSDILLFLIGIWVVPLRRQPWSFFSVKEKNQNCLLFEL